VAARLWDIVQDSPRRYRGEAVKWAGDGVMFRFRDPAGAVRSALDIVCETYRRPGSRPRTSGWRPDP
jgi:adenylate cyclase